MAQAAASHGAVLQHATDGQVAIGCRTGGRALLQQQARVCSALLWLQRPAASPDLLSGLCGHPLCDDEQ